MVCFDGRQPLAYAQRQSDLEQRSSATDYTAAVQTNQEQQAEAGTGSDRYCHTGIQKGQL